MSCIHFEGICGPNHGNLGKVTSIEDLFRHYLKGKTKLAFKIVLHIKCCSIWTGTPQPSCFHITASNGVLLWSTSLRSIWSSDYTKKYFISLLRYRSIWLRQRVINEIVWLILGAECCIRPMLLTRYHIYHQDGWPSLRFFSLFSETRDFDRLSIYMIRLKPSTRDSSQIWMQEQRICIAFILQCP